MTSEGNMQQFPLASAGKHILVHTSTPIGTYIHRFMTHTTHTDIHTCTQMSTNIITHRFMNIHNVKKVIFLTRVLKNEDMSGTPNSENF